MRKKNYFIALIPARKGSKGVKNKNIVKINNKYLIEHTLEQALKSKIIDKIYVSSNDKRIKKITEKFKKVNFLQRKNYLSNSKTLMKKVILDFFNFLKNSYDLKIINLVLLQPTSPQRKAKDIDKAIRLFNKQSKYPLISASEPISNPNDVVYINKKKLFSLRKTFENKNRQDFKDYLFINGSIYIANAKNYIKKPNFLTKNSTIFKMDKKHSIEINDYFDLKIIKEIMK
jgi:CMP-N-acetylneuraminic acid synthetase